MLLLLWVTVTGWAGPVQSWVQGQLASLDLSCTRSGWRYQLRAHCQPSPGLWAVAWPQGAWDTFISSVRAEKSRGRGEQRWGVSSTARPCPAFLHDSHDVMKPPDEVMTQIPQLWGNDFRHGRPGSAVQDWRKHDSANKMVQFSFQYRDYIKL